MLSFLTLALVGVTPESTILFYIWFTYIRSFYLTSHSPLALWLSNCFSIVVILNSDNKYNPNLFLHVFYLHQVSFWYIIPNQTFLIWNRSTFMFICDIVLGQNDPKCNSKPQSSYFLPQPQFAITWMTIDVKIISFRYIRY